MLKIELAHAAGVSYRTFNRWISRHRDVLSEMGVLPHARLLPPSAVRFICDEYGIDVE